MNIFFKFSSRITNQKGASAIIVAISLFMIVGFAALAIDLTHHYIVKNELKNAADAGALAGARFLYNDTATEVNHAGYTNKLDEVIDSANQIAYDAARANRGQGESVEVENYSANNCDDTEDVQRGHWTHATRQFNCSNNTDPTPLFGVSDEELEANTDFINAVKVRTRRETTPILSFFATIFGHQSFTMTVESVAWLGFENMEGPADLPIAVCQDRVLDSDGNYNCNIGRMFRTPSETAMWTTLQPCQGDGGPSVNSNNLGDIVESKCEDLKTTMLTSSTIGTNNGQIQTVFSDMEDCWRDNTRDNENPFLFGVRPWKVRLPVINCIDMQNQTCAQVVSIVEVNILWVNSSPSDYQYPVKIEEITVMAPDGIDTLYHRESWPTYPKPGVDDGSWNEVVDSDGNTVYLEKDGEETPTLLITYHEGDFYEASDWSDFHDPAAATVADLWTPEESWSNQKKKRSTDLREGFWGDFVDHYDLRMVNPDFDPNDTNSLEYIPAEYDQKTLYFIPDCKEHPPEGGSGIHNFATLAKRPKLVK